MVIKKNIPQLRFPEFKGGWEKKKLGDIMSNKSQKYNPKSNHESFKCIELEHLASETGHLIGYTDSQEAGSIKNRFEKGDVLFGKLRPYLRKYLLAPFTGVCSSEIWVLTGKKASNEFIYRLIQTNRFIGLANQSSGSKMPRADWDVISSSLFYFPTLPEQQKIASFFTAIDQKISQLKRKLILLDKYKTGVMQLIFSQQIRFKDNEGQEFPKWEKKRLGSILKERNIQVPKSDEYPLMAFVAYKGVSHKGERYNREFLVNDGVNKKYKQTEYGDFIYSSNNLETGSIGLNSFGSASISPVYSIFQIGESCNPQFLSCYLVRKIFINKMTSYRQGVVYGQWRIHESDFLKIEEMIPCIEEQTRIANFLSAIDDKINHTQTQIEKVEHWKKGLLQKMFV